MRSPGFSGVMLEPPSQGAPVGRELPGDAGRWCPTDMDRGAGQSLGPRLRPSLSSGCKAPMNRRELRLGGHFYPRSYTCVPGQVLLQSQGQREGGTQDSSQSPWQGLVSRVLVLALRVTAWGRRPWGSGGVPFPGSSNGTDKTIVQVY